VILPWLRGEGLHHRPRPYSTAGILLCVAALVVPCPTLAQSIDFYFPQGNFGYDQQLGVTVQTRAHPLYTPQGVQIDSFNVQPRFDESLFYNSNVTGLGNSASLGSRTSAGVSLGSNWTRNSLAASVGVDHFQYFSLPDDSYTNWNVGLAGGYSIGDSQLLGAYSHQSYYQLSTTIGTVRSTTPIQNSADSIGFSYTFNLDKLAITPSIGIAAYRFGSGTAGGITFNQAFLNYNSFAAGVTARYALNEQSGILAVVRGLDSDYLSTPTGQPSNDSKSLLLLAGIDYQAKSVWRYRLLGGIEVRKFASSQFPTKVAPDVEASVIWTPTGLTTVDVAVSSTIAAPQTGGTNGYVLSQGRVVVDHELRRNVFLQGRASADLAQFLPHGTQKQYHGGASVTWLLNRAVSLDLGYDYYTTTSDGISTSSTNVAAQAVTQYTQHLLALTLRLAL
jgi:hypothetical protein